MKKSPRTLLLDRHQAKTPELDRQWEQAIAPTLGRHSTETPPSGGFWHRWWREGFREVVWAARWGWTTLAMTWGLLLLCNHLTTIPARSPAQEAKSIRSSASFAQTLLLRQHFLVAPEGFEWTLPSLPNASAQPASGAPHRRPINDRGARSSSGFHSTQETLPALRWVSGGWNHSRPHPGGKPGSPRPPAC